jgi:outer membrane protein assembly factor BamD
MGTSGGRTARGPSPLLSSLEGRLPEPIVTKPTAWRRSGLLAALVACGLALAACADKEDDLLLDDTPADQLYNEGLAFVQRGDLREATKTFEKLDQLHPYSEYSRKAMVMTAYVEYSRGNYTEAINASRRFLTLFPGSPDAAYALFIIGQSYYHQVPDVSRDQEMAAKAMGAYDELIRRYPDSEYANEARTKVLAMKDQLAGKEMEIGRFYLHKKDYIAAISRFRIVIVDYQTTRHVEEALARVAEAYYAMGVVKEAQTAAAVLGHNFPDSPWYKSTYTLLQTGGYGPENDSGSWISKAFANIKLI